MMVVCRFNKAFFSVYGHRFYFFPFSLSLHFFASLCFALLCILIVRTAVLHIHMLIRFLPIHLAYATLAVARATSIQHRIHGGMRESWVRLTHTHWADRVYLYIYIEAAAYLQTIVGRLYSLECWTEVWVCVCVRVCMHELLLLLLLLSVFVSIFMHIHGSHSLHHFMLIFFLVV